MRVQTLVMGLLQAALLTACERQPTVSDSPSTSIDAAHNEAGTAERKAGALSLGTVGDREVAAAAPAPAQDWSRWSLPDLAARTLGAPLADSAALVVAPWAGLVMTLGAAISIGGNVSGTMLTGPRYLYALAKEGFGPAILAKVHRQYQTPAWAIATQGLIAAALALSGSFVQLATLSIIARLATYIGTAAAVPVLRRKFETREQTIVLPGGPAIPILALLLCLGFLASATAQNLIAGLVGLTVGVVIYFFRRR